MTRKLFLVASVALSLCSSLIATGCQSIGSRFKQNAQGVESEAGSPNKLALTDAEGQWTADGVGPSQFTEINDTAIQTFQSGMVQRNFVWTKGKVALSSGTDFGAERATFYDVETGNLVADIQGFNTSASQPLLAFTEAQKAAVDYLKLLPPAQVQLGIEQLRTGGEIASSLAPVFATALEALVGIPPIPRAAPPASPFVLPDTLEPAVAE